MSEKDLFSKYVKPGDVVFDIGANVGLTVRAFLELGAGQVYAFEPSPNNFDDLVNNCKGEKVVCLQVALHEREYTCVTPFKDCRTDYTDHRGKKMDSAQTINYRTLKSVCDEQNLVLPDIVKLDVEGMESLVMKTFDFLLKSRRAILFVEIHAQPRSLDNQDYADNPHYRYPDEGGYDFNRLKNLGYIIERTDGTLFSPLEDWNFPEATHEMFVFKPSA